MKHQVIYLLAPAFGAGAAVLPVGIVTRAVDTGLWDSHLLETPEAATWSQQILAALDPAKTLPAAVVAFWQEAGNGISFDVRVEEAEGTPKHVFAAALAELISDFAIISEES